jgi:stage V sporulation protein AD
MASKRIGAQTVRFASPPVILGAGVAAGPMEGDGPLGGSFDEVVPDLYLGQQTYEKAERELMKRACHHALAKARIDVKDLNYFLAGDLLNQLITSTFNALPLQTPFLGLYGACSTSMESLGLAAMLCDGGFADKVLVATSSHNATAERQYRYPVEYGSQRRPYAQWTVTAAGAAVVAAAGQGEGPRITHVTTGKVVDLGIKDPFDQGAAMAPAAIDTMLAHFNETGRSADYYDLIVTGDLASFGKEMALEVARRAGLELGDRYEDCGVMIYDRSRQDVHSGGSGCGCSAAVVFGHLLKQVSAGGRVRRLLVVATGALLSPTTFQQGENIPAIAHAVAIEA